MSLAASRNTQLAEQLATRMADRLGLADPQYRSMDHTARKNAMNFVSALSLSFFRSQLKLYADQ